MTKEQALQKIKELEAFVSSIEENADLWEIVQTAINQTSSFYKHYWVRDGSEGICVKDDSITIYLPSANTEWYFDVMKLSEQICKIEKWNIYPIGNNDQPNKLILSVWKKS